MKARGPSSAPVLAIFTGGGSRRMNGRPKGRLLSPLSLLPIVEHLVEEASSIGMVSILVGDSAGYIDLAPKTPRVTDADQVDGPLGGMLAAAEFAEGGQLVCVGCDMPFVSKEVLEMILRTHPKAPCLAVPLSDPSAGYEPFLSRWSAEELRQRAERLVGNGTTRLRELFVHGAVKTLPRTAEIIRALRDWDLPGDLMSTPATQEP